MYGSDPVLMQLTNSWLQDDEAVYPTLAEKGRRAAESIVQQRRQLSESSLEERSARL